VSVTYFARHTGPQKRLTMTSRVIRAVTSLLPGRPAPLPRRAPLALPPAPPRNVIVVKADPADFGTITVKQEPGCPWETVTTGFPAVTDELVAQLEAEEQAGYAREHLPATAPVSPRLLTRVHQAITGLPGGGVR
jgi:hypothetical protein